MFLQIRQIWPHSSCRHTNLANRLEIVPSLVCDSRMNDGNRFPSAYSLQLYHLEIIIVYLLRQCKPSSVRSSSASRISSEYSFISQVFVCHMLTLCLNCDQHWLPFCIAAEGLPLNEIIPSPRQLKYALPSETLFACARIYWWPQCAQWYPTRANTLDTGCVFVRDSTTSRRL